MTYFDEEEIAHLFAQIALPLHLVHSNNILHRDLKVSFLKNTFFAAPINAIDFIKFDSCLDGTF